MSKLTKGIMIYLGVLAILLTGLTILERIGLRTLQAGLNMMGGALLLWSLLAWGAIALFRKFRGKNVRMIGGVVLVMVVMLLGSVIFTFTSQFAQLLYPSVYATIRAEDGRQVVILYAVDTGFGSEEDMLDTQRRMDERRDWILANDPDAATEEGTYPEGAYGYAYCAYPKVYGFFYDARADVEGVVYRGLRSEAKILYEWQDGNVLRLYLEDPEVGDSGEVLLRL